VSIDACAALVQAGDPDRFMTALSAPPGDRAGLMVLYAFNLEIARATWITKEAIITEMRLQFWTDVINDAASGAHARPHEVARPLAELVSNGLPAALLLAMVDARLRNSVAPSLDDPDLLIQFLDATAGNLMWLAAKTLGAPPQSEPVVRDMAHASGLASLLVAVPALNAAGRAPFSKTAPRALRAQIDQALGRLRRAQTARAQVNLRAAPAMRAGYLAKPILLSAARDLSRITSGTLAPSEFRKRLRLLRLSATGQW